MACARSYFQLLLVLGLHREGSPSQNPAGCANALLTSFHHSPLCVSISTRTRTRPQVFASPCPLGMQIEARISLFRQPIGLSLIS
ncbi:hypothetical protein GGR57DRAFT_310961 [Xylariaceae sp. FL1272]|nr:hypothetical protein GGR57DRAFT_310961 [Xylariaceae sp. FL1272]